MTAIPLVRCDNCGKRGWHDTIHCPEGPKLPDNAELFSSGRPGEPPSGFSVVRDPLGDGSYNSRIETVCEFADRKAYVLMCEDVLSPAEARKIAVALLNSADEVDGLAPWVTGLNQRPGK